jgi:hypothetical protein
MMEERKRRDRSLRVWRFPYSCVCHWLGMPQTTTLVRPSVRRTHSYGNLPYNITRLEKKHCSSCPHKSLHTINKYKR